MYKIIIYSNEKEQEPFIRWLEKLSKVDRARIKVRLDRIKQGNFGDFKNINEISELRFNFSSGYRVYFTIIDNIIILLLAGGDKKTQSKDIEKAKLYKQDYINRSKKNEKL